MLEKNKKDTKIIFVTGGVISGIGKGIVAASVGNILKSYGYSISMQKLDPYLNIDPGVLSPYEHGEVYVTKDGGETDLDLGHYERFTGTELTKKSNYTSGKITQIIFEKERKGLYNGKTVQIVPHLTNEIKNVIISAVEEHQSDFHIVEIGGTVGDFESNAFVLAISQMGFENKENTYFIHTTYVPFLSTSKEFKTKPTQFSLSLLASNGIRTNMIILRSKHSIGKEIRKKIASSLFLPFENVISLHDFETVYQIPLFFEEQSVAQTILNHFNMKIKKPNNLEWIEFAKKIEKPKKYEVKIAMIGKYVELEDAYKSIQESINIASTYNDVKVHFKWIPSEKITHDTVSEILKEIDGVVVLPGFGERGFEGKVVCVNYTRINQIPTLGICFGMQAMTINQAKLKGIKDATSSEISTKGTFVLDIIKGKNQEDIGGTLRLGADKVEIKKGTIAHRIYGTDLIIERSRHRYEVNPKYIDKIVDDEFIFSGHHPSSKLVEICELKNHPFYVGVQYHPEFSSRPLKPHKLFNAFIDSIVKEVIKKC